LGSPGEDQLDLMPGNVTGIPPSFQYHLFRFLDWKEEARVQKQEAAKSAKRTLDIHWCFYMDFGFMQASSLDYKRPNKGTDRVIDSWDHYSLYLLVVDEAHDTFGSSSQNPRSLLWTSSIHSCTIVAMN
jgi:hypothetical protein